MRKILFRGKRVDNGEWILGSLIKVKIKNATAWIIFKPDFAFTNDGMKSLGHAHVDPETVGQCVGLKDMNGKWIFEGDVLEHHIQGNILVNRGVVNWDAKNARWAHQLNTMNPCFYMHNPETVEVIGNIHDNPELLEGVKE